MDRTGLYGRYSFTLHWIPEVPPEMPKAASGSQSNHRTAPSEPSGPSLFGALREQLGVEVQPATALVNTIAVQHIENPAKN